MIEVVGPITCTIRPEMKGVFGRLYGNASRGLTICSATWWSLTIAMGGPNGRKSRNMSGGRPSASLTAANARSDDQIISQKIAWSQWCRFLPGWPFGFPEWVANVPKEGMALIEEASHTA